MPDRHVATPLTELGDALYARMDGQSTNFSGGLYPDGSNTRPPEHEAAGLKIASQIVPLNLEGEQDPGGSIVIISLGMSNTLAEWFPFIDLARRHPDINPSIFFINGAQGGQTAEKWVNVDAPTWGRIDDELARYGLTPAQVQVAWIKQTLTRAGGFPAKAQELQTALEATVQNLIARYPNIRIAYLSSRTRSFTYFRGLSPEPVAYETGFSVKWLIEKQIMGDPALNYDPSKGDVKAPYLSWGPYLWIDGGNPRLDGRVWLAEDMTSDCTHPSEQGSNKVAEMLLEFFLSDTVAAPWFLSRTNAAASTQTSLAPPATDTPSPTRTFTPEPTHISTVDVAPVATQQPTIRADRVYPQPPTQSPTDAVPSSIPVVNYALVAVLLFAGGLAARWILFRKR